MKPESQKMPIPHPLMNRAYNPATARDFFDPTARQKIGRLLPLELMKANRSAFEDALDRISIAAWRFLESQKVHFPTKKQHRTNLEQIRDSAIALQKLLQDPDTETYRRVYQQLGQKHPDQHYKTDPARQFESIAEEVEEYFDGKRQYEELELSLQRLAASTAEIISRLPNPREGRPPTVAPPILTSFAHAVADIWCRTTGQHFIGATDIELRRKETARTGPEFLECVLALVIPDISEKTLARLVKKVAKERCDEAKTPSNGRREKSGRGALHHYKP